MVGSDRERDVMAKSTIKDRLKRIKVLYNTVVFFKCAKSYLIDFIRYNKYCMKSANSHGDYSFNVMLDCHAIEKGLCHEQPRYFGQEKVQQLISYVDADDSSLSDFERRLAVGAVRAWVEFCERNGFSQREFFSQAKLFVSQHESLASAEVGTRVYEHGFCSRSDREIFDGVVLSRHSSRRYDNRDVGEAVILDCMKHFVAAPSACNRQMCKVYWVKNSEAVGFLEGHLKGLACFDVSRANFLIVTYAVSSLGYPGERHQGYLNAGLASMNLVNALHSRGIGSTFIEWSNDEKESERLRCLCDLPKGEEIAVVISCGYYLPSEMGPASARRPIEEMLRVVA